MRKGVTSQILKIGSRSIQRPSGPKPRALELTAEKRARVGEANGRGKTGYGRCPCLPRIYLAECYATGEWWNKATGVGHVCLACVLSCREQRPSERRCHARCSPLPSHGWAWRTCNARVCFRARSLPVLCFHTREKLPAQATGFLRMPLPRGPMEWVLGEGWPMGRSHMAWMM